MPSSAIKLLIAAAVLAALPVRGYAEESTDIVDVEGSNEQERMEARREHEVAGNEDPEANRRASAHTEATLEDIADEATGPESPPADAEEDERPLEFYASVRINAVNEFDPVTAERSSRLADGQSRVGIRAEWEFAGDWYLFGRGEAGFDALNQFSSISKLTDTSSLTSRLLYVGVDHTSMTLTVGQNWSSYYKIAGMTDRFAIFGGSASGVYAGSTTGGATGLGRADDVVQVSAFVDILEGVFDLKPFNLNVQYQAGQPIPRVDGESFDYGFGISAWLETQSEFGIGLAYNRSRVPDLSSPAIVAAGIDGDMQAFAMSFRNFGPRWYASLLFTRLKNVQVSADNLYIDSYGIELYAQWEVLDKWWLIGGGNAAEPDAGDPDAGEARLRYGVLGARYAFDSFKRMVYVEWRIDESRLRDGSPSGDQVTVGVRWDFGD